MVDYQQNLHEYLGQIYGVGEGIIYDLFAQWFELIILRYEHEDWNICCYHPVEI